MNLTWYQGTEEALRQLAIRSPTPQSTAGYNHGPDHSLPIIYNETPHSSTAATTPALTDSQSDLFHSPTQEDTLPYAFDSLEHQGFCSQARSLSDAQNFSSREYRVRSRAKHEISCTPTDFSLEAAREGEFTLGGALEEQAQGSQAPNICVTEGPMPVTYVAPLRFSRATYNSLLQARAPIPEEVNIPPDNALYSFAALERRGCRPVISFTEIGAELLEITIDFDGSISVLVKENFCRVPGCGYWAKNAGRVPRHRLTHFKDRGYECQNPYRRGTGAPHHLQCQLGPGQYVTRLDLFKKHFRASNCQGYTPAFANVKNLWHGPDSVDETCLLPFTKNVHVPFRLKSFRS